MKKDTKKAYSAVVLTFLFVVFHMLVFRGKVDTDISIIKKIPSAILAIVFILPVHEFIHCIFMKILGLKDIRIETARDPFGFISLRTTASGKTYGWKKVFWGTIYGINNYSRCCFCFWEFYSLGAMNWSFS